MTPTLPFAVAADLPAAVAAVRAALAENGVVALPTETFYGLAADPTDPVAVDRVFALKGRPADKALPVVAASLAQVEALVRLPEPWRTRLATSWPAPLSAVLPLVRPLPFAEATLAVRIPSHPLLRRLLARVGPLTATSANRAGAPPASAAGAVLAALPEGLALLLDGGVTEGGLPSTLLDCCGDQAKVLRPGAFCPPPEWDVKRG